ncbi:MAG TPA: hypothetical protein PKE26_10125 [Kiritimatiellia bacterium]|nr:hypothetical protein [Kiritimatiellia bacterium]HMO99454.1 hypothetical protein [Kiritimatiellia bacterium]HMP97258.1 hypothetical protein [Kiritimatiellia bacterium]
MSFSMKDLGALWGKGDAKKQDKAAQIKAVILSIIAHIALIAGASYLTVLVIAGREKVMFEAKTPPSIPARKLEHSIRVKKMQEQVRKPQILQRMVSQAPSAVALPELPKMDNPDMKKMRDTPTMTQSQNILGDLGRAGGGLGRGQTGGGGFSDAQFFGQNVRTRAVIIAFDNTQTVINKGLLPQLAEETGKLLQGLTPATKFNLIAFVDGAAPLFPSMVFATQENKKKAIDGLRILSTEDRRERTRETRKTGAAAADWNQRGFVPNITGNHPDYSGSSPWKAIEMAAEMEADTLFIITDDDLPNIRRGTARTGVPVETHTRDIRRSVDDFQKRSGRSMKINVVIYKPNTRSEKAREAISFYRGLAGAAGGRLTTVD